MGRGRAPCCEKMGLKRGPWTPTEDMRLVAYIQKHGHGNWRALPKQAGLLRCGKSCRLRWTNYLRPDIKRGNFSPEEEETIINLHELLGNKWSTIASHLPGRTDNEIKNVWNTHLKKRLVSRRSNPNPSANQEPKGSSSSSSSISSASSSSHCSLSHTVEEQLDAMFKSEIPPEVANMKIENIKDDPLVELLQIPIEPDQEFLDMLEDQSYHNKSIEEVSVDRNGTQQVSITNVEESVEDGKSTEWITYLENELELWPNDYTQLSPSKDVVQIKPLNPNHLYDGILDEEVDPVSIYFQKWPSASSIFKF